MGRIDLKQEVLPAISDYKSLEKFLKKDLEYCVVMNFSLIHLHRVCRLLREGGKKCLVHVDLIKGIASNEYGAEFLIDGFKVEGLISTHPSVVEMARKKKAIAILRIFILDSQSLRRSLEMAKKCQPDYMEILPGFSSEVAGMIKEEVDIPLIGGGLIQSSGMVKRCIENGLIAVTASDEDLWK